MPPDGPSTSDHTGSGVVPLADVRAVFADQDDRARPLTATDVMEAVGCSRRTAHNKLNRLVEKDELETRKVGSRSRVWWVPIPADGSNIPNRRKCPHDLVDTVDLPGTGKTLEARKDALLAAYEYLQEHPEAKKSDFLQDVFPENPAEYETAEGWWNAMQPALAELPGVKSPEERGHIWHFLGG